ncbi:MAG: hypothetical protein L0Y72_15500 [Gemmataceae bacterium]|nr:hypothetical protein [Gemmataceae bacterium]MCI0740451.1 hypothetical protein [Gemmataceae bacterium]
MHLELGIAGLGLSVIGAILLALADAWFSRSVLMHLDALEANLSKVIEVLQGGGSEFVNTGVDLKRDRGQNRARSLKNLGWTILVLGLLTQVGALWLFFASQHP